MSLVNLTLKGKYSYFTDIQAVALAQDFASVACLNDWVFFSQVGRRHSILKEELMQWS